jgi:hypothetical protein
LPINSSKHPTVGGFTEFRQGFTLFS